MVSVWQQRRVTCFFLSKSKSKSVYWLDHQLSSFHFFLINRYFFFQYLCGDRRCKLLCCGSRHSDVNWLQYSHSRILQDLQIVRKFLFSLFSSFVLGLFRIYFQIMSILLYSDWFLKIKAMISLLAFKEVFFAPPLSFGIAELISVYWLLRDSRLMWELCRRIFLPNTWWVYAQF